MPNGRCVEPSMIRVRISRLSLGPAFRPVKCCAPTETLG